MTWGRTLEKALASKGISKEFKEWIAIAKDRPKWRLELELELIQTQMTQKPMLRAEVGMRVRCANKASAGCIT